MAQWSRINIEQLKRMRDQFQQFEQADREEFCKQCAKDLAGQLLRKAKQRTPIISGELRRNWMIGGVIKQGNLYMIEVINNTPYASYVEYGHRPRDQRGFRSGKFMLTIAEEELKREAPRILEQKLERKLREVFGG